MNRLAIVEIRKLIATDAVELPTFTVYPGCPLTRAGCAKFTNIGVNGHWRGFDRIPSSESGSN